MLGRHITVRGWKSPGKPSIYEWLSDLGRVPAYERYLLLYVKEISRFFPFAIIMWRSRKMIALMVTVTMIRFLVEPYRYSPISPLYVCMYIL